MVRMTADVENNIVAVERIKESNVQQSIVSNMLLVGCSKRHPGPREYGCNPALGLPPPPER